MKDPCEKCKKRNHCKVPGECSKYQKYWMGREKIDNPFFYRRNEAVKTDIQSR